MSRFEMLKTKSKNRYQKKNRQDKTSKMIKAALKVDPYSSFYRRLEKQLQETGTLSEKQLLILQERVEENAIKLKRGRYWDKKMPPGIVNRGREPVAKPLYQKDEEVARLLKEILHVNPHHKGAASLKPKFDTNKPLTTQEKEQLKTFHGLVCG